MSLSSLPALSRSRDLAAPSKIGVKDPIVTRVRFEGILTEGKMYCVFEAPDKSSFENWLKDHRMPYDYVVQSTIGCEGGSSVREI